MGKKTSEVINVAPSIDHGGINWDRAPVTTVKSGKSYAADPAPKRKADASAAKTRHAQKVADLSGSEILKSVRRIPAAKRADPTLSKGKLALAAAKRADPVPTKPTVKGPLKKADTVTTHVVKNVGQLGSVLSQYGRNCKWDADRKFAIPTIVVKNIRGRIVAEIKLLKK